MPAMSSVARTLLSTPATSAPSERLFSSARLLAGRLDPSSLRTLFFLQNNWDTLSALKSTVSNQEKVFISRHQCDQPDQLERTNIRESNRLQSHASVVNAHTDSVPATIPLRMG
eukprot:TRINITY_DN5881_c0_g2_i1.p2 TRINITY_DN5881_c0_g2~~TRINITY_DN5881_c0_g2_i1.p2  ORF type:complete len:114 (-),score=4.60 TRINITY_DN5881_c0_g2_i1:514-855(-)